MCMRIVSAEVAEARSDIQVFDPASPIPPGSTVEWASPDDLAVPTYRIRVVREDRGDVLVLSNRDVIPRAWLLAVYRPLTTQPAA